MHEHIAAVSNRAVIGSVLRSLTDKFGNFNFAYSKLDIVWFCSKKLSSSNSMLSVSLQSLSLDIVTILRRLLQPIESFSLSSVSILWLVRVTYTCISCIVLVLGAVIFLFQFLTCFWVLLVAFLSVVRFSTNLTVISVLLDVFMLLESLLGYCFGILVSFLKVLLTAFFISLFV